MAQQALEASSLVGQNRNRVHGQSQAELEPYRVYNLAPHRAGGYTPYGRRVRLQDGATDITLADITRLIGYDETGVSSFSTAVTTSGTFSLFRGTTLHVQTAPSYSVPGDAIHLASAGAYSTRDAFLVLDREHEHVIEPTTVDARGIAEAGEPTVTYELDAAHGRPVDVQYGNGKFILITTGGFILESTDNGSSWTVIGDYSAGAEGVAYASFQTIDYGSGVWLIVDAFFSVLRSTDDGATWTRVSVISGFNRQWFLDNLYRSKSVAYSAGDVWYIAGTGNNGDGGDPEIGIHRSADGGQTWTCTQPLQRSVLIGAELEFLGMRVATGGGATSAVALTFESRVWTNLDLATESWDYTQFLPATTDWVWVDAIGDRYMAINASTGQVATSPSWDPDPTAIDRGWTTPTTLSGRLEKSRYSPDDDIITIVGSDSVNLLSKGRIWQGESVGSLQANTGLEDAWAAAGGAAVQSVAYGENDVAIFVGYRDTGSGSAGLTMATQATPGLDEGTYQLFYLAYVNTPAGRLLFDFERDVLNFVSSGGNSLTIQAHTVTAIIGDNPWLSALPLATAQEIVRDMRLDVYIQYAATTSDLTEDDLGYVESTTENTIRYAFTVPFPEAPDVTGEDFGSVGKKLGALPIGRQLILHGAPTTAIFEKSRIAADDPVLSRTAIHNSRVWGLARQDETPWENQGDNISLEIANQFNRFVLTYTETGWANLISDQSFIPIQPTQSTYFTGIMGTPSGLMVMFDNEIFLITGDPAFGNLSVDLYLDMAGCDLGTVPAMVGGLPFVIWDGKIWALQAGQAQEISGSQWRPEDPFVHICAEPQTRSLVAITESGVVLRYLLDDQFWLTDPSTRDAFTGLVALPNAIDPDLADTQKGRSRIVDASGNVWVTYADGTPDTPHLVYRDIDFGQPERRTPLYTAKVTLEGPLAQAEYDRDAVGYDATALPAMFYGAANANNGSTHETYDPQALGIQPVGNDAGARSVQTLAFRAPLRQTRSYSLDLRFELRGMAYTDTVKLPLRLFYAAGGATR